MVKCIVFHIYVDVAQWVKLSYPYTVSDYALFYACGHYKNKDTLTTFHIWLQGSFNINGTLGSIQIFFLTVQLTG